MIEIPLKDLQGYASLNCRLGGETLPKSTQCVYLLNLSEGMLSSCYLLELTAELAAYETKMGRNPLILFNGNGLVSSTGKNAPETGWPGAEFYEQELLKLGVSQSILRKTAPARNTREEANEFVASAKELNIHRAAVVSVPYHWEKLLVSLVGAMAKHRHLMKVWFALPRHVNWHQRILGSQGVRENIPFIEEAGIYVETYFTYVKNGRGDNGRAWINSWGSSAELAIRYLDWRDGLISEESLLKELFI